MRRVGEGEREQRRVGVARLGERDDVGRGQESRDRPSAIFGPWTIAPSICSMSRFRTLSPWSHASISAGGSLRASASNPSRQAGTPRPIPLVQLAQPVEEPYGLLVGDDVRVNLLLRAQLGQPRDRMADVALLEEGHQLVPEARPGEVADVPRGDALAGERDGVLVHAEPVPVLVADRPEDSRRVVDERAVVQDADPPGLEVGAALERVDELAEVLALERDGHRVDREVAAVEVLLDRPRRHRGEHGRCVVRLAAGRHEVEPLVVAVEDDRGSELLVRADASVELLRDRACERDRVPFDDDVDVEVPLAEQDVADGSADEVDALVGLVDGDDRVERGRDALRELERRHAVILPWPPAQTGSLSAHPRDRHVRISPIRSNRGGGRGYRRPEGQGPDGRKGHARAIASISTSAPDGRAPTSIVDRAGGVSPMRPA